MTRHDLELYAMGEYDGDSAALEREVGEDERARAIVAEEARFELLLRDAAAAAAFCPACDDLVRGARCDACGAAVRPGGYVVERVLVSNAHGRMYEARDADGKQVALKELAFVQCPTVEVVAAFEREVKFLRALDHPAIPRFCASFEEGAGIHVRYYLAQELVAGESLADRLESHWYSEAEIIGIARQVLDVLVYLQGLSPMVIHRDIKPANLVVRGDGSIAVVDFGAAHVQGMTVGSTAIGTFGYMPIEQLAGEVDATTDVFALGASLLHLVTRKEPWRILHGGTLAGLELNLSRPMRAWLGKLVAAQPRDRFRSAAEARGALDRVARGRGAIRSALARLPGHSLTITRGMLAVAAAVATVAAIAVVAVVAVGEHADIPDGGPRDAELRDAARRSALETRQEAMVSWMVALRDLACRCTDRRCVDEVSGKVNRWSKEMASIAPNPETMKRITELSDGVAKCLARAAADPDPHRGRDPGAPPTADDPAGRGGGHVPMNGMIHDVAKALAETCGTNLIVPGDVTEEVHTQLSTLPCDHALNYVTTQVGLSVKGYEGVQRPRGLRGGGQIYRLALERTLRQEESAREERERRGIVDDPLPYLDRQHIKIKELGYDRAPVREVIEVIAQGGRVDAEISKSIDATITVHAHNVDWDRLLVAVVETAGLGYRYDASTRRLRVAPRAEIDAEMSRGPRYGFLLLNDVGLDRLDITIDGVITQVPADYAVPLRAGIHRVELRGPGGAVSYSIRLDAGVQQRLPSGWQRAAEGSSDR